MPPKKVITDDIVEALLDPRVVDALGKALGATISGIVEARLDAKLRELLDSVEALRADNTKALKAVTELQRENDALRSRVDDLDVYSRMDNLIIHGIVESSFSDAASSRPSASGGTRRSVDRRPDDAGLTGGPLHETNAATEEAIVYFANNVLDVALTRDDISVAHRLGKRRNDQNPAPIIVKFTNRRARNAVFGARKSLANHQPRIFINEHLIKSRAELLSKARQLVKAKKIQSAWTNNGQIFIRLSDLPDSRPIRIDDLKDLPSG
jgi:hypothetical protein